MGGVVRCHHCGAPHRRETASTRFRCDWCGGDNRVEAMRLVEELVLATDDHSRDPATRVREALGSRGLRGTAVTPQPARWAALWQVVNAEGEEYLSPALASDGTELPVRTLPAGPLRLLTEDLPGWTASLGPRPSTEETADSIVDAARATFDKADADVVLVRLVWVGVQEFGLRWAGESFGAIQILGTDRVIFDRLPRQRATAPLIPERLALFGGFAAAAIAVGVLVKDPVARLVMEAALMAAGTLIWMVRRDRDFGGAR
jgi:hypothetical protein